MTKVTLNLNKNYDFVMGGMSFVDNLNPSTKITKIVRSGLRTKQAKESHSHIQLCDKIKIK